jgi:hypothetical protein
MNDLSPGKIRRLIFIISGATDALIGAAILLVGLGWVPIDFGAGGPPTWALMLIGAVMFIAGIWVAVYNFSRLDE